MVLMKTYKKLLSSLLALAMSVYIIPTVWAEDLTQQIQDTPENPYSDNAEKGIPQTEDEIIGDDIETEQPQDDNIGGSEEGGIMPFSLLPLDPPINKTVIIDRSDGVPPELEGKPRYSFLVSEALSGPLAEDGIIGNSEAYTDPIMYSFDDSDYVPVGWNDVISLEYENDYVYFILGNDQLNIDNQRYRIYTSFNYYDEDFIENTKINAFNASGEKVRCIRENAYGQKSETGYYFNKYCYVSDKNFRSNEYPRFLITLPDGYSANNVEIYEGLIYDISDLDNSENIAYKIIDGGIAAEPYGMDYYSYPDNYVGIRVGYKDLTIVITLADGRKQYLPVRYQIYISSNQVTLSASSYNSYTNLYSSPGGQYLGTGYFSIADSFDSLTGRVYAYYYDYIDENSNGFANNSTAKINFACFGKYNSMEAALLNGEVDIKDDLFGINSPAAVDFSKCENMTAYLYDGTEIQVKVVEITALDIYGILHNEVLYWGIADNQSSIIDSGPSDDTYFNINGVQKIGDDGEKASLSSYRVRSSNDTYFKNGYQTVFILDDGAPVADGTVIYPLFSKGSGVNVYAAGYPGVQNSGESPITFKSGTAVQYSAASESGTHLKNYWVTFVTQQRGAKLFVNAVNNPDHYSANGRPQREVFLDSRHNYRHEIFFANIGSETLTGITVSLSEDTQGVKLDDYWTVIDNSVGTLAPFTKTNAPDNIAKIRLVPIDEEAFSAISGTLNISTANGGSVDIELTGIAGVPKITTDKLYDGVKYVPYSSVIMTNNMYGSGNMSFSISDGSLPDGLELRPNGEIYGIPTSTGTFTFTAEAVYNGAKQEDGSQYSCTKTYTIVIADNTDDNVDATNTDEQGHQLMEKVSKYVTVYYSETNSGNLAVDRIEIDSDLFWSEGPLGELQNFYIDGIKLTEGSDYIAEEGSTKITVRAQTFGHTSITGSDVPHTLAAEFRSADTNELKRSAQNVYLDYINNGSGSNPGGSEKPGENGGSNSTNGTGGSTAGISNPTKGNDSVNTVMRIVDADGYPVYGLSVELHSAPKRASTDENGMIKFNSVEFGRHTLYITRKSDNKKISKTFSIASGSSIGMKGNVITASAGDTVYMTIEYDGSKISIDSVAEDVSSSSGAYGDGKMLLMDISKNVLSRRTLYAILLIAAAASAFIIRRKIKS